jgi:hypothetical protein
MDCSGQWSQPPPIGKPMANHQLFVLDQELNPVGIGISGELYIGGIGLARGYLGKPGFTAKLFKPNPFSSTPGERLYKTGDLVRWLSDGNLQFLDRVDRQVKIRGFRVELGEIESILGEHPDVTQAVVVVLWGDTDAQLVGYILTSEGRSPDLQQLREFLLARLPAYMVPTWIIHLSRLPLNTNGKINYPALPTPEHSRPGGDAGYVAPRNSLEEKIARDLFGAALGIDRVGVEDELFALGGNSLHATMILSQAQVMFGTEFSLPDFFEHPTVAYLAELVVKGEQRDAAARVKLARTLDEIGGLSEEEAELRLRQLRAGDRRNG